MPFLAVAASLPIVAATAAAQLVINEILPDPAGSDAGHEFVEFLNTGTEPYVMAVSYTHLTLPTITE